MEKFTAMGPRAQLAMLTALTKHGLALSQATRDKISALDPESPSYLRQVYKYRALALLSARESREANPGGMWRARKQIRDRVRSFLFRAESRARSA